MERAKILVKQTLLEARYLINNGIPRKIEEQIAQQVVSVGGILVRIRRSVSESDMDPIRKSVSNRSQNVNYTIN